VQQLLPALEADHRRWTWRRDDGYAGPGVRAKGPRGQAPDDPGGPCGREGETQGSMSLVVDAETNEILGVAVLVPTLLQDLRPLT
jgi:hypothetical protein